MSLKRLLIVDDDTEFLDILKQVLSNEEFDVTVATSAVEGGLILAGELPNMILMDIKMKGINGLDACKAIKKNPKTKDIPIIIVSALCSEDDIKSGLEKGAIDYFTKPVDLQKLVSRIKQLTAAK
jgi:DNA-binding response OmpR family regulator